jgi:hypothetical protein
MRGGYTKAKASLPPAFFPLFSRDGAFLGFEPVIVADSAAI